MDKKELKKKIVAACLEIQHTTAQRATAEMEEAYHNATEYGTPEDWFDTYKADMLNKRNIFSKQLQKIQEDIRIVERIDTTIIHEKAVFGSVIITDNQKLFIAVGIGKIIVNKEEYYSISPSVPLFQAMKGLKAGDTFEFRGSKQKIIDIF